MMHTTNGSRAALAGVAAIPTRLRTEKATSTRALSFFIGRNATRAGAVALGRQILPSRTTTPVLVAAAVSSLLVLRSGAGLVPAGAG